jgi:hypothetical protein
VSGATDEIVAVPVDIGAFDFVTALDGVIVVAALDPIRAALSQEPVVAIQAE